MSSEAKIPQPQPQPQKAAKPKRKAKAKDYSKRPLVAQILGPDPTELPKPRKETKGPTKAERLANVFAHILDASPAELLSIEKAVFCIIGGGVVVITDEPK